MRYLLPFVFFIALALSPADATVTRSDSVIAVRAATALRADASLSDPVWQSGRVTLRPAFENLTTRTAAPADATTAYVLYDDQNLYVGFTVRAGGPITATQTTNGTGFGIDDFVGIGIDPSGSGSPVYYFEATPRGTRYQQSSENSRFNPTWEAAATTVAGAWNAVMVIPLRTMRIASGKHNWRINFLREDAARGEHFTWAYDGIMQDGAVGQAWPLFTDTRFWPTLQGIVPTAGASGRRPQPRADVYGLISTGGDRHLFQQADGTFESESIRNLGIDASIPLTNTIALVGTLSPDFSNVEIDQQTIAPQEFARQLIEYRPFFAQGASFINPNLVPVGGFFSPPNLIFYSPIVGPFDRGVKIEGTVGPNSFGALSFRGTDLTTGDTFDDQAYGYSHARSDGTFTFWSDGVLAHHSLAGADETAEAGFKGRNLHTGLVFGFDGANETGHAQGGDNNAHSFNGFVDLHKPNYEVNVTETDVSPHYGPLDGFTAISDIRGPLGYFSFNGSGRALKNWSFFTVADRLLDDSGAVHEADVNLNLTATFKNKFSIDNLGPTFSELRDYAIPAGPGCSGLIEGRSSYGGAPCYLDGQTRRYNLFVTNFGYGDGTSAPIDAGYSFGSFGGNQLHGFTSSTSRPIGSHLSTSFEYDGSWERAETGGTFDSQFLRRLSLVDSLDINTTVSLSYRATNGLGGFAIPGHNLAIAFHRHANNGNEFYVNFGTPAANSTLNRLIVKYSLHFGAQPGT